MGIPVGPGRGSAAGSLVSYAMGITDIDPLQYGLLFERFLNPERVSMPDIDIDFCMNRRGEVIQYVTAEVRPRAGGADHHLQHAGRARGDQGRGPRAGHAVRATWSASPSWSRNVLNITLDRTHRSRSPASARPATKDPQVDEVLKVGARLEGLARNCSVHAAGVVISPQPLTELVPLYKTNSDEIVTAVRHERPREAGAAEDGLPGADHAHLIDDALKLIEKRHGVKLDLGGPAARRRGHLRESSARASPAACSSLNPRGMRDILRRYQPSRSKT